MSQNKNVKAVVKEYFRRRYNGFSGVGRPEFGTICTGKEMEEEENRYLKELYRIENKGLYFSEWRCKLFFRRVVIMDRRAFADVEESHSIVFRRFGYPPSRMRGTLHRLKLIRLGNRWYIEAHTFKDELSGYVNGGEVDAHLPITYSKSAGKRSLRPYDRGAALTYAHKWALGRNPKYYDFENLGGDCTNFCSQTIHAGGAPMNFNKTAGWYYSALNDRSPSWTGVEFLYRFLTGNKGIGPHGRECMSEGAEVGDIIQLDFRHNNVFNHSLVIVSNPQPGNINRIMIATHTIDRDNYPLIYYDWRDIRYIHIEGYI